MGRSTWRVTTEGVNIRLQVSSLNAAVYTDPLQRVLTNPNPQPESCHLLQVSFWTVGLGLGSGSLILPLVVACFSGIRMGDVRRSFDGHSGFSTLKQQWKEGEERVWMQMFPLQCSSGHRSSAGQHATNDTMLHSPAAPKHSRLFSRLLWICLVWWVNRCTCYHLLNQTWFDLSYRTVNKSLSVRLVISK